MKIFWPLIEYESFSGLAEVRINPKSVPQCASVKHMVPNHSPVKNFGR